MIFLSLCLSLSDRVQRKPLQLSLSSSVPYENLTRESKFDNSVCETTVSWTRSRVFDPPDSHRTVFVVCFFFRLQNYYEKPTLPSSPPLALPPPTDSLSQCASILDSGHMRQQVYQHRENFWSVSLFEQSPLQFFPADFRIRCKVSTFWSNWDNALY